MYITVDHNGKKYAVTRTGHVATVVFRQNKDGEIAVIHRQAYVHSQPTNKVRALAVVKLDVRDVWSEVSFSWFLVIGLTLC